MLRHKMVALAFVIGLAGIPNAPATVAIPGSGEAHATFMDIICGRPYMFDVVLTGSGLIDIILGHHIGNKKARDKDTGRIPTKKAAKALSRLARALTGAGIAQIVAEMGLQVLDATYCSGYGPRPFWWWD